MTLPVAADGLTVAVKVTEVPKVDGLSELVTTVVVEALATVKLCWTWGAAFQLPLPAWFALIVQVPAPMKETTPLIEQTEFDELANESFGDLVRGPDIDFARYHRELQRDGREAGGFARLQRAPHSVIGETRERHAQAVGPGLDAHEGEAAIGVGEERHAGIGSFVR